MARLVSAVYPPAPNGDCLQFWYYMLGNNTGSLSVYLRPNDGSTDKLLFRRVGNQAVELWLYESQTIRSNVVYQVSHPIAIQFPSLSCSIYRYIVHVCNSCALSFSATIYTTCIILNTVFIKIVDVYTMFYYYW